MVSATSWGQKEQMQWMNLIEWSSIWVQMDVKYPKIDTESSEL